MEAAEEIKTISKQLENAKGYVKVNFNHRCCGGQERFVDFKLENIEIVDIFVISSYGVYGYGF